MLLVLEENALGEARWLVCTHVELGGEKDPVIGDRTITELPSNPDQQWQEVARSAWLLRQIDKIIER
jgi:hypothetical protein